MTGRFEPMAYDVIALVGNALTPNDCALFVKLLAHLNGRSECMVTTRELRELCAGFLKNTIALHRSLDRLAEFGCITPRPRGKGKRRAWRLALEPTGQTSARPRDVSTSLPRASRDVGSRTQTRRERGKVETLHHAVPEALLVFVDDFTTAKSPHQTRQDVYRGGGAKTDVDSNVDFDGPEGGNPHFDGPEPGAA